MAAPVVPRTFAACSWEILDEGKVKLMSVPVFEIPKAMTKWPYTMVRSILYNM